MKDALGIVGESSPEVREDTMARYKPIDMSPKFIPVDFSRQILPGSFEYALCHLSITNLISASSTRAFATMRLARPRIALACCSRSCCLPIPEGS